MAAARSQREVAAARATAQRAVQRGSDYGVAAGTAVIDTLDWLAGSRDRAPATDVILRADEVVDRGSWRPTGLAQETIQAGDLEELAMRSDEHRAHLTRYGAVWATLSWYQGRGSVQLPVD